MSANLTPALAKAHRTRQVNVRERQLPILTTIYNADGPLTGPEAAADAGFSTPSSILMGRLVDAGLVRVAAKVMTGKRGRPAHRFTLTDKGRKRVQRALKSQEA